MVTDMFHALAVFGHSGVVFESFDQAKDFFHGHQGNYLTDISQVLTYTGRRYNFYDVMVMALDPPVLREQITIARTRLQMLEAVSNQRRLNFATSARMLLQSLQDRERITKIQGLLNQLMTFIPDELSIIIGAYDYTPAPTWSGPKTKRLWRRFW